MIVLLFSLTVFAEVKVTPKTDLGEFSKNCRSKREYVEFSGVPAAEKINARIRKEMTVGKKLKESDCPGEGDKEDLEYSNLANFTGERNGLLGVYNAVLFPGGSGRYAVWCTTFDEKTGKVSDLSKCLKPKAEARITEFFCAADKNCRDGGEDDIYCLVADGVNVKSLANGKKRVAAEITIKGEDLKKIFKESCGL